MATIDKDYVFGLDIGTRNVVGTVGYNDDEGFHVVAQYSEEHDSRAMIDGQIHDINRVSKTIENVKKTLEEKIKMQLAEVCIAAAGRVLRTITTRVALDYEEETVVSGEDLHTLDLIGVDQAQKILKENEEEKYKFYCVGYSVMKYYLNGELFTSLEGHKANKIEEVIIVTFLPEDVVDGLYSAVEKAGLKVANLTLEPIAAINVAIPESFRMLNIALVDVGAGTSDICITRDGSIIAYGMIPYAGDELTEAIVHGYLVDFATAELIKKTSSEEKEVTFDDIMGLSHTIPSKDVWKLVEPIEQKMANAVAEKIIELNGDKAVSAAFVVGGGGRVHGFTDALAKKLDIVKERVAIRGEEVMKNIIFESNDLTKDSLIVTPIGICLNYYEQKNNFIMIHFNDEMMKLYDNGHLTVVDAAMQAGWDTDELFPRRGKEIHYTINGTAKMIRGEEGESAIVKMNDNVVGLNTPLEPNCYITIEASTEGGKANCTIEQLEEFTAATVDFFVSGNKITCPKFVEVNGSLEPGSYEIKEGDVIETRSFYTVGQIAEFMDVEIDENYSILVNGRESDKNTLVYENFDVDWTLTGYGATEGEGGETIVTNMAEASFDSKKESSEDSNDKLDENTYEEDEYSDEDYNDDMLDDSYEEVDEDAKKEELNKAIAEAIEDANSDSDPLDIKSSEIDSVVDEIIEDASSTSREIPIPLNVIVNKEPITLTGKSKYVFVDVFDFIDFDTRDSKGRAIVTLINGERCGYSDKLKSGDKIDIYWQEINLSHS